jgi:hypothetical protein
MTAMRALGAGEAQPDVDVDVDFDVDRARAPLAAAWALVTALALAKVSFVLWAAGWAAVLAWRARASGGDKRLKRTLLWAVAPLVGCLALCALMNQLKFGAPWSTGYHEWRPDQHRPTLHDAGARLLALFAGPQRGLLIHAPLLLGAALAWPSWWRRWRREASLLLLLSALSIVTIALLPSWEGGACYGPRYLVTVVVPLALPILSLPDVLAAWRRSIRIPVAAVQVGVLLASVLMQVSVNHLGFMAFYSIDPRRIFSGPSPVETRLFDAPFGVVNGALILAKGDVDKIGALHRVPIADPESSWRQYGDRVRSVALARNYWWVTPPTTSPRAPALSAHALVERLGNRRPPR